MNTATGTIIAYRHLSTTKLGNNRYTVALQYENGYIRICDTAPNKSIGNALNDFQVHTFKLNKSFQLSGVAK